MHYRFATQEDTPALQALGVAAWEAFTSQLSPEHGTTLMKNLADEQTYLSLLETAQCLVCEASNIVGMAFLVPSGNPTDIYPADWCYIRFVSVHPAQAGKGIGRTLVEKCIALAIDNNEHTVALHTSELMLKAQHIYEKAGFTRRKELPPRLGIRYWLYTKQLLTAPRQ